MGKACNNPHKRRKSEQVLQNLKMMHYECLLAKSGFDTAENESSKVGRFLIGVGGKTHLRSCGMESHGLELKDLHSCDSSRSKHSRARCADPAADEKFKAVLDASPLAGQREEFSGGKKSSPHSQ